MIICCLHAGLTLWPASTICRGADFFQGRDYPDGGVVMSGIETTGYVFGDLDHLARAKLALVFGLNLVALLVLFRCTAAQKSSFFNKYAMLTASWPKAVKSAAILSLAMCVATVYADRYSGMTTLRL